jgi:tellurite resistance protein TerC
MGVRFLFQREKKYDPANSRVTRLARRLFPISDQYEGGHFFTRCNGRRCATPLLLVLIMIEVADVTFALDSIPAIFSVTQDAFIIFTSNILAILGLRSLYFVLARALSRFHHLSKALAVILMFIGIRMLLATWIHNPTAIALLGIVGILGVAILASLLTEKKA